MAKTLPPGEITIEGVDTPFTLNAVPDVFDERDLEYRPRLDPLPASIDNRDQDKAFYVLHQVGNSCTGHAVAGVVNTIYAHRLRSQRQQVNHENEAVFIEMPRLSPYMLYYLARRYDEFEGEEDLGSSLRGAFKGWFYHGLCFEKDWPDLAFSTDLDHPDFRKKCRQHPLGAYYRINPYRLDDMQSAIWELDSIAVSAAIHDGWKKPVILEDEAGKEIHVIARSKQPKLLGGHAFILVGYNNIGFLVQNSWGPAWGKKGFATLPYEDWLDSAYDAWVARPGVPQTPFYSGRAASFSGTNGALVLGQGPNIERLSKHIVNLGNEGRFSTAGKIRSTPAQVEGIFENMERQHAAWIEEGESQKRHILLYAHGGMVSESAALSGAQASLNWWLNNRIYPIYFAWQTGLSETILSQIFDTMKGRLPAGGLGFDLEEQFDRLVERLVKQNFTWAWEQMKGNAWAASKPLGDKTLAGWSPGQIPDSVLMKAPGASLIAGRLARYIQAHGPENVAVHLVGHSAGSIFHAALLQRLAKAGVRVASLAFLAPGLRVDMFARYVLPHLGPQGIVEKFTNFSLSDKLEMDDTCGQGEITIYHKSLLYLVSKALEKPGQPDLVETPLVGLERSFDMKVRGLGGKTLRQVVEATGGTMVVSRSQTPPDLRSEAVTHGAFDNDPATMTSVLLRALGLAEFRTEQVFQENAVLTSPKPKVAVQPVAAPAQVETPHPAAAPQPEETPPLPAQPPPSTGIPAPTRPSGLPLRMAAPAVLSVEEAGGESTPTTAPTAAPVEEEYPKKEDCPIIEILEDQGLKTKE
jgi:hypothetical protein